MDSACPLQTWAWAWASCQMPGIVCWEATGSAGSTSASARSQPPTQAGLALCAGQKNAQTVTGKGGAKGQIPLLWSWGGIPHVP